MCVEVTHKVLRNKTAYNILNDCHQQSPQYFKVSLLALVIRGLCETAVSLYVSIVGGVYERDDWLYCYNQI